MPASKLDREEIPGQRLAIWAETWYLLNMLPLPVIGFGVLLWLYFRHRDQAPPLAHNHLQQTVTATLWAAALLFGINVLIILLGGYQTTHTWIIVFLYFITCHSAFILLGVIGLVKALAGESYRYPLVGR